MGLCDIIIILASYNYYEVALSIDCRLDARQIAGSYLLRSLYRGVYIGGVPRSKEACPKL